MLFMQQPKVIALQFKSAKNSFTNLPGISLIMYLDGRVESLEAGAPMQADASHDDDHEGDEERQLNETLERSSYPRKKKETLVGGVTGGADTPTVSEGRSKGTETVIDNTILPIAVESTERDQLGNLDDIPPENGRESFVPATAVAAIVAAAIALAATAAAGRSKQNVSSLVVQHDCPSTEHDIEKGNLSAEATAGEDAPGSSHQHNDDERRCRICQLSTTDPVINLGCACEHELSRAHLVCALTWFQSRRNRECEICGAIPKNVHIREEVSEGSAVAMIAVVFLIAATLILSLVAKHSQKILNERKH